MWKRLAIIIARFYEKIIYNTVLHRLIAAEISHIVKKKERAGIVAPDGPAERSYFEGGD